MTERTLAVSLALQNMRAQQAQGLRPKKPSMPQAWLYPHAQENAYAARIGRLMSQFFAITEVHLRGYDTWQHQDAVRISKNFASDWDKALQALRDHQKLLFEGKESGDTYAMVSSFGESVSEFNFKEWTKHLSKLAGTPYVPAAEPWVAETVTTWSDMNFELVRSLSDDYIKQLNAKVVDAVSNGTAVGDLTKIIRKLNENISKPRARVIARDQIGKLNGQLMERRQSDAGVAEYTWKTANDERVRSSHAEMQGKACEWKDPTKYKDHGDWVDRRGDMPQRHPGMEIQCRCYASPNMDEIWAEAERTAKAEGWFGPQKKGAR